MRRVCPHCPRFVAATAQNPACRECQRAEGVHRRNVAKAKRAPVDPDRLARLRQAYPAVAALPPRFF